MAVVLELGVGKLDLVTRRFVEVVPLRFGQRVSARCARVFEQVAHGDDIRLDRGRRCVDRVGFVFAQGCQAFDEVAGAGLESDSAGLRIIDFTLTPPECRRPP